jgi:hypothetical protein
MRPLPHADGHDAPWLIDEVVPGEAAMIDDVVVGFEDAVRPPIVTHEVPDVLDRVELGAPWRQRQEGDVGRDDQLGRTVPSDLIKDDDGMGATWNAISSRCTLIASLLQRGMTMQAALPSAGADCAEDPGRGSPLIARNRGTRAAYCPAPDKLGLLPDPGFILPPQLYECSVGKAFADLRQTGGEAILKMAMSSSF